MSDGSWFKVEQERAASWRGLCFYTVSLGDSEGATCSHRTKRMGSEAKAETAIKDHLRDVHEVDL